MNCPDYSNWLGESPFGLAADKKSEAMVSAMSELTRWHQSRCAEYARVLEILGCRTSSFDVVESIPYIPVRLFKELDLRSVEPGSVFKTMTSSGTSGQQVSRIYLDRNTAFLQSRVLSRLVADTIGSKRLPLLVIDSPSVLKDRRAFSARGAGVLGFSMFGQDRTFALDEKMKLNVEVVKSFLARHGSGPILVFGFTYMVWLHLCEELLARGMNFEIRDGILLHGGGWKRLQTQSVNNERFKQVVAACTGVRKVVNYYGMVEQTGSIFLECEHGHLHASIYSDVIVRDPVDFQPLAVGEVGLIETLSVLPLSYPGHAILTEDMGRIDGVDDCPCGRKGKYFSVIGRLPKAEIRGCSDAYENR